MFQQFISVVVPCYNESAKIRLNIGLLFTYLYDKFERFEIIAVNDGSTDNTLDILKNIGLPNEVFKILDNGVNKGKGYSVKNGVLNANGSIICFTDADLSTPVEDIGEAVNLFLKSKADVVIGSRRGKNSMVEIEQPWYRKITGNTFSLIRNIIVPLEFEDTQCGFKCFSRESAIEIFSKQTIDRFAFDVEILYIAKKLGYQITSFPVKWKNDGRSSVHIVRDSWKMFKDLIKIKSIHRKIKPIKERGDVG